MDTPRYRKRVHCSLRSGMDGQPKRRKLFAHSLFLTYGNYGHTGCPKVLARHGIHVSRCNLSDFLSVLADLSRRQAIDPQGCKLANQPSTRLQLNGLNTHEIALYLLK